MNLLRRFRVWWNKICEKYLRTDDMTHLASHGSMEQELKENILRGGTVTGFVGDVELRRKIGIWQNDYRERYRKNFHPVEDARRGEALLKSVRDGSYQPALNMFWKGMTPAELLKDLEENGFQGNFDYPGGFEKFKYDVEHDVV